MKYHKEEYNSHHTLSLSQTIQVHTLPVLSGPSQKLLGLLKKGEKIKRENFLLISLILLYFTHEFPRILFLIYFLHSIPLLSLHPSDLPLSLFYFFHIFS